MPSRCGRAAQLPILRLSRVTTARILSFPLRRRPAVSAFYMEETMSDMRLVVAGAGGRMGRTVIKAIAETDGVVLAGAIDAPGAAVIGCDAGELAGLGRNGIAVSPEAPALLAAADGLVDFTIPAA